VEINSAVGGAGEVLFFKVYGLFLIGAWWSYLLELFEFRCVFLVEFRGVGGGHEKFFGISLLRYCKIGGKSLIVHGVRVCRSL